MENSVILNYLNDYDINELNKCIENSFNLLNLNNKLNSIKKVLVKVCLPDEVSKDSGESTHPAVVRAIVDKLAKMNIECVVAECPNKKFSHRYYDDVYMSTGFLEMANLTKCVLNRDLSTAVFEIPNGIMTKSATMLNIINEVDAIINIGKLKIDENFGYVGATANIFGLVPSNLKNLMLNQCNNLADYNNYLIDIYETIKSKVCLNVLDAIVALEAGNTQRMLNCLAVSDNIFSLDAAMFDVLGIKYEHTILKQAYERGLFGFENPYKMVSGDVEKFKQEDFLLTDFDGRKELKSSKLYFATHQQRPVIEKKECKGCQICSKICPTNAIVMKYDSNSELYAEIDYSKCIFCKKCIAACPYSKVKEITPHGFKKLEKRLQKYNKTDN